MPINLNKPERWNADTAASVDLYNNWFMSSAPETFRSTRKLVTAEVEETLSVSKDLADISPSLLKAAPKALRTFRMACCPPLAVDRLIGLAGCSKNLVKKMTDGDLPPRMKPEELDRELGLIVGIINRLLDRDIFNWLADSNSPSKAERYRAATIIADRLTGADANPIIRNAQEKRQLVKIERYLLNKGYEGKRPEPNTAITNMQPGTFAFHMNIPCSKDDGKPLNVSVDVVIQPHDPRKDFVPLLIEAKSAGDYTNTNKRRKEESDKLVHLQRTYGKKVPYLLFLNGYFDSGYLGYEAAAGIDWIWEHRMEDFDELRLEK